MRTWLCVSTLAACGSTSGEPVPPGSLEPPAECALEAVPAGWTYPTGATGTAAGDKFASFELDDCGGQSLAFDRVLSGAELVLFNVGAGWCQPCIEETETIDQSIFRRFCSRGLRVVQVLFQDERSQPATSLFCRDWRERFSLSFPVLIDPLFETETYFDAAQTPLNLLIDAGAVIRFRQTGTPAADLPDRIDVLLPP